MSQKRRAPIPRRFENLGDVWEFALALARAFNVNVEQGVFGPANARAPEDNKLAQFDGADGQLQASVATLDDDGNLTIPGAAPGQTARLKALGGLATNCKLVLENTSTEMYLRARNVLGSVIFDIGTGPAGSEVTSIRFGPGSAASILNLQNDCVVTLADAAGARKLSILDSGSVEVFSVNSDGEASLKNFIAIGYVDGSGAQGIESEGNLGFYIDSVNDKTGREFQFFNNGTQQAGGTKIFAILESGVLEHLVASGTLRQKLGTCEIHEGSGSPEGVVTAPVGSTFHRTDGGAGTSFYVKESGTGNTGWVGK